MLGRELEILEKGKLVVGPLWLFVSDFWGLVRLNIPRALARDPSLLTEAKIVARRSEAVNEMMKSRENYRVNNQALSGFTDAMAVYDRSIREEITTLQSHLAKLEVGLAAASGWRNVIDVRRLRRGGEPDAGGASHNPARIERRESGLRRDARTDKSFEPSYAFHSTRHAG